MLVTEVLILFCSLSFKFLIPFSMFTMIFSLGVFCLGSKKLKLGPNPKTSCTSSGIVMLVKFFIQFLLSELLFLRTELLYIVVTY